MGYVDDQILSMQECVVCGNEFIPHAVAHVYMDANACTCSYHCQKVYDDGMDYLADLKNDIPDPEPEDLA